MNANDEASASTDLRDEYNAHERTVKRATAVFWFASGLMVGALLFVLLDGVVSRVLVLWLCCVVSWFAMLTRGKAIERIDEIGETLTDRIKRRFVQ